VVHTTASGARLLRQRGSWPAHVGKSPSEARAGPKPLGRAERLLRQDRPERGRELDDVPQRDRPSWEGLLKERRRVAYGPSRYPSPTFADRQPRRQAPKNEAGGKRSRSPPASFG
jgi:hypothetical protein